MRDGNVALLERSCSVASDLELAKTAVWTGDKASEEEFTTFFIKNKNNAIKELFNDLRVVSQSFIDYCVLSVDSKVKDYNSFWWKDQRNFERCRFDTRGKARCYFLQSMPNWYIQNMRRLILEERCDVGAEEQWSCDRVCWQNTFLDIQTWEKGVLKEGERNRKVKRVLLKNVIVPLKSWWVRPDFIEWQDNIAESGHYSAQQD